jgi:hypothetical protein
MPVRLTRMQGSRRARPVLEISGLGLAGGGYAARRRRRWPWALGAVVAVTVAALAFAYFAWPRGALTLDSAGLAFVRQPSFGGAGVRVGDCRAYSQGAPDRRQ